MNTPSRSLFALAVTLFITLTLPGCGNGFHPKFAFLQESAASTAVVHSTTPFAASSFIRSKHARTHVQAASKKIGVAAAVDIGFGNFDVYVGNLSGHNRRLAEGLDILNVQLSSDGTKIVFTALDTVTEYYQVYVGDSKLETVTQLTSDLTDKYNATLSPDGETVAYNIYWYDTESGYDEIWTVPAAGGTQAMVPVEGADALHLDFPAFTPDGLQLVFSAYDGETDAAILAIANLDGTNATGLTRPVSAQWDLFPSVSADSSLVTFSRAFNDLSGSDVDEIPITGEPLGGAAMLTDDGVSLESMFVDDQIVFLSRRDGAQNIYKMDADGSNQMRLTTNDLWQFFNLAFD